MKTTMKLLTVAEQFSTTDKDIKQKSKQWLLQALEKKDKDTIRILAKITKIELLHYNGIEIMRIFEILVSWNHYASLTSIENRLKILSYLCEEFKTEALFAQSDKILNAIHYGIDNENRSVQDLAEETLTKYLQFMLPYCNINQRIAIQFEINKSGFSSAETKANSVDSIVKLARDKGEFDGSNEHIVKTFKRLAEINLLDIEIINNKLGDYEHKLNTVYAAATDFMEKMDKFHKMIPDDIAVYRQDRASLEEHSTYVVCAIKLKKTIKLYDLCQFIYDNTEGIHVQALMDWCSTISVITLSGYGENIKITYVQPPPTPGGLKLEIPVSKKQIKDPINKVNLEFAGTTRNCSRLALTSQSEYIRVILSTADTYCFTTINESNMTEFSLMLDLLHTGQVLVNVKQLTLMYTMSTHFKLTKVEFRCRDLLEEAMKDRDNFFTIWKYIEKTDNVYCNNVYYRLNKYIEQNTMVVTSWLLSLRKRNYKTTTEDIGESITEEVKLKVHAAMKKMTENLNQE
jgi:hypothetical protein